MYDDKLNGDTDVGLRIFQGSSSVTSESEIEVQLNYAKYETSTHGFRS